jgi:hypothetical protein
VLVLVIVIVIDSTCKDSITRTSKKTAAATAG